MDFYRKLNIAAILF